MGVVMYCLLHCCSAFWYSRILEEAFLAVNATQGLHRSHPKCKNVAALTNKTRFLGLVTECTVVAAIQLRMRMRILTRPDNSLANFGHQISNKKLRIECEWFCEWNGENLLVAAEIPCEWTFATKFTSDCECDGVVHSGWLRKVGLRTCSLAADGFSGLRPESQKFQEGDIGKGVFA